MKYSEKMSLLLKGVKLEEIKQLEEQEAAEAAEAAKEELQAEHERTALEAAEEMVKDLEAKLATKEDELTKLNRQFAELNNKQTVSEEPIKQETAADVMQQLFKPKEV